MLIRRRPVQVSLFSLEWSYAEVLSRLFLRALTVQLISMQILKSDEREIES